MLSILCPDEYHKSVLDLKLDSLHAHGIRGIIIDLDNTLLPWDGQTFSAEMIAWVEQAKKRGFSLCIASNGMRSRVRGLAQALNLPYISKAVKPRKRPFKRALQILDLPPKKVAVVGDQIFTDILGGNRMGLYTILINPMSTQELRTTKIVRRMERRVMARLHRRGLISSQALSMRQRKASDNGTG